LSDIKKLPLRTAIRTLLYMYLDLDINIDLSEHWVFIG